MNIRHQFAVLCAALLVSAVALAQSSPPNQVIESNNGNSADLFLTLPTTPGNQLVCLDNKGNLTNQCVGHDVLSGPLPAIITGFGTNPQLVATSNDNVGRLVVGTGGASTGTITFAAAWSYAPVCMITDETNAANNLTSQPTAQQLVINGTMNANDSVTWQCRGMPQPGTLPVTQQPGFYVSNNGNNANSGLTAASPFLTLAQCQTAMRAQPTGGLKTCYVMSAGGTFTLGSPITLTSSDNGENWIANGFVSGNPDFPLISGNNSLLDLFFVSTGTQNVLWEGLTFENTAQGTSTRGAIDLNGNGTTPSGMQIIANHFLNLNMGVLDNDANGTLISGNFFENSGNGDNAGPNNCGGGSTPCHGSSIEVENGSKNNTIQYNLFKGGNGSNTQGGCVFAHGTTNLVVQHNFCENTNGMGIGAVDFSSSSENFSPVFSYNIVHNTNLCFITWTYFGGICGDSGGIYILGRFNPTVNGKIDHNYVDFQSTAIPTGGSGNATASIRAIYMDDCAGSTSITNNITFYGNGSAIQIHNGSNVSVNNNQFVLANNAQGSTSTALVQLGSGSCNVNPSSLTNDNFANDIVVTNQTNSSTHPATFISQISLTSNTGTADAIEIDNATTSCGSGCFAGTTTSGGYTMSNIFFEAPSYASGNPLTCTPSTVTHMCDMTLNSSSPTFAHGFVQIDQSQMGIVNPSTPTWNFTGHF